MLQAPIEASALRLDHMLWKDMNFCIVSISFLHGHWHLKFMQNFTLYVTIFIIIKFFLFQTNLQICYFCTHNVSYQVSQPVLQWFRRHLWEGTSSTWLRSVLFCRSTTTSLKMRKSNRLLMGFWRRNGMPAIRQGTGNSTQIPSMSQMSHWPFLLVQGHGWYLI